MTALLILLADKKFCPDVEMRISGGGIQHYTQYLHNIYTISTQYLHYIYTASTLRSARSACSRRSTGTGPARSRSSGRCLDTKILLTCHVSHVTCHVSVVTLACLIDADAVDHIALEDDLLRDETFATECLPLEF